MLEPIELDSDLSRHVIAMLDVVYLVSRTDGRWGPRARSFMIR